MWHSGPSPSWPSACWSVRRNRGVPFAWVAGDEVYGNDRNLRLWLEREEIPHVLAVKRSEKLWALTEKGPRQVRADRLASQVEETGWIRCSAGDGAKGPRVYGLGRGGDTTPEGVWQGPLAAGPAQRGPNLGNWPTTSVTARLGQHWRNLVRVAGIRWAIEECFEEAKGQVGLDQYEVRRWEGWYRAHHAVDAGPRLSGGDPESGDGGGTTGGKGGYSCRDKGLIPLTVPEVRRLLTRLVWTPKNSADFVLGWSQWRRRHQATAQRCHYQRRLSLLALVVRL